MSVSRRIAKVPVLVGDPQRGTRPITSWASLPPRPSFR